MKIITEVSKNDGLEINKEKSYILGYNNENITEIEGIKVVDEVKYLELTVDNKKGYLWNSKIRYIG